MGMLHPNVDKMQEIGNIKGLIKALKYKQVENGESYWRCCAAVALGELKAKVAVPCLCQALEEDVSHNVRRAAARALEAIGDPAAIPALLHVLLQENDETLADVAKTLEILGWVPGNPAEERAYFVGTFRWDDCVRIGAQNRLLTLIKFILSTNMSFVERFIQRMDLPRIKGPAENVIADVLYEKDRLGRSIENGYHAKTILHGLEATGKPGLGMMLRLFFRLYDTSFGQQIAYFLKNNLRDVPFDDPVLTEALSSADSSKRKQTVELLESLGWKPGADALGAYYRIQKQIVKGIPIEVAVDALENIFAEQKTRLDIIREALSECSAPENAEYKPRFINAAIKLIEERPLLPQGRSIKDEEYVQALKDIYPHTESSRDRFRIVHVLLGMLDKDQYTRYPAAFALVELYKRKDTEESIKAIIEERRSDIVNSKFEDYDYNYTTGEGKGEIIYPGPSF